MDLDRHSSSTPSSAGNSRRPISPCGMERKPLKRKMQVVRLCVVVLLFCVFFILSSCRRHIDRVHPLPIRPISTRPPSLFGSIVVLSPVAFPTARSSSGPIPVRFTPLRSASFPRFPPLSLFSLPFALRLYLCPSVSAPPTGPASVHFSAQPVPHPRGGLPSFGNLVHTAGRGVLRVAAGRQSQAGHQAQRQTVHSGWTLCFI